MPIIDGKYVAPIWRNDNAPAINASELQDMSDSLEDASGKPDVYSVSAVLLTDGWTLPEGATRYQQVLEIEQVKAESEIIIVDCDLSVEDDDARIEILSAWEGPSANNVLQGDGTLTFFCYELPTISIPIKVGVI